MVPLAAAAAAGCESKSARADRELRSRRAVATQETAPGSQRGRSDPSQPSGNFDHSLVPLPLAFAFACSRSRQPGCSLAANLARTSRSERSELEVPH